MFAIAKENDMNRKLFTNEKIRIQLQDLKTPSFISNLGPFEAILNKFHFFNLYLLLQE